MIKAAARTIRIDGNKFKYNQSFKSYFSPSTFKSAGTIVSLGILTSGAIYKLKCSKLSTTACDSPVAITIPPTTKNITAHPNALKKIQNDLAKLIKNVNKTLIYIQRLSMYFLYGIPLTCLVPATYLLGDLCSPVEEFTWTYLVWAIQQLGPCFVKLAQWASTRPDLFPPRLIDKIAILQDDVRVFHSFDIVEGTLREAFGADWRSKIEIDPNPLGAGSVAQVFKGMLKSSVGAADKSVAIKMIHPHVEKLVHADMELLSIIASVIDSFPSLEVLSIGETMRQFADAMTNQLDLRYEAMNLIKFAKKFTNDNWACFPSPIEGFVTKNVLVETLIEGAPISNFLQLKSEIGDSIYQLKMKLSDLGVRLILKMVFFDNFIHGDLHPGNIFVQIQPNGEPRLAILDCGIVYQSKSDKEHQKLVDICFSFMQHNGREAAKLMIDNQAPGKVKHSEEFCESVQALVDSTELHSYFEHIGEYVAKICELARVHVVRLDPGYFKIAMALKVAEGISLALNRDLDLVSKCVPIVLKARAMQALGVMKFPTPEEDEALLHTLTDQSESNRQKTN